MPNDIQDLHVVDSDSFPYIVEWNATVNLQKSDGLVRVNVFRPKTAEKVPVLCTYGPYGKDIPYKDFHAKSFSEVNPNQKSQHSAWETPDPGYWTKNGYAIVRADERGCGQSPGLLDTMSQGTSEAFFDVVEWAASQPWSSGKVGLLGCSYFAGTQWRVAARSPKGLSAIIPWEGMSDYYRDRCRHGGILSNQFITFWWNRQVVSNQYGKPGRKVANWGPDTIEGDLGPEELAQNRRDQTIDNVRNKFRDDEYYASKDFDLADIKGYLYAGSDLKYLRFITGRHDLPLYYDEEVELQRSFLDAFLKGDDRRGWSVKGKLPPVDMALRKGDVGFNDAAAEKAFPRRTEWEWPIARTQYTPYYLTPDLLLSTSASSESKTISYKALGNLNDPQLVRFTTAPFPSETEITGHIVTHLSVSASKASSDQATAPSDIDLFLTLRHISLSGKEIFYTGTAGDPVPLTKGWLRTSLRKVHQDHPRHREWLPHREYLSSDVQVVQADTVYEVDVEVWPTNVVVEEGGMLVLEVSSGDTQGTGIFGHHHPEDRGVAVFEGSNNLHIGGDYKNYVVLPIIPPKEQASGS